MANKILLKRGSIEDIDSLVLSAGELAVTLDTQELYVGDANGVVVPIRVKSDGADDYYTKIETDSQMNELLGLITIAQSDINALNTWVNAQFEPEVISIIDENVRGDLNELEERVSSLGNQLDSGSKYVYVDENGNLIITKEGSLGKFVAHPDRTSLYVGETEVAYVKNNTLYSAKTKTDYLQIGPWAYELTADNTLNEKWMGDE